MPVPMPSHIEQQHLLTRSLAAATAHTTPSVMFLKRAKASRRRRRSTTQAPINIKTMQRRKKKVEKKDIEEK